MLIDRIVLLPLAADDSIINEDGVCTDPKIVHEDDDSMVIECVLMCMDRHYNVLSFLSHAMSSPEKWLKDDCLLPGWKVDKVEALQWECTGNPHLFIRFIYDAS